MMYIEPTSQFKFVAKPTPVESNPVVIEGAASSNSTTNLVNSSNLVNTQPQLNAVKALPAPEVGQNKGTRLDGNLTYDGKRMRKAVQRRTVDYNSSVIRLLESRKWFKSSRNQFAIQPQEIYNIDVVPPAGYIKNPINAVTTKFVRTSTNKLRCPIFCVVWTPEGRRLVTGASSGEFTLWNGLTFNFETILQAHDRAVRAMVWSHHDAWLLTGDHGGFVKYWQSNMNNVKMYEAHKEPIRGLRWATHSSNSGRPETIWSSLLVAIVSLAYLKFIILRVVKNIFMLHGFSLVQITVQDWLSNTCIFYVFILVVATVLHSEINPGHMV